MMFGKRDKGGKVKLKRVVVGGRNPTDNKQEAPTSVKKTIAHTSELAVGDKNVVGANGRKMALKKSQAGACIVFHPKDEDGAVLRDRVVIGIDPNAHNYHELKSGVKLIAQSAGLDVAEIVHVTSSVVQEFNAGNEIANAGGNDPEIRRRFDTMVWDAHQISASDISLLVYPGARVEVRIKVHGEWRSVKSRIPPKMGNDLLRSLMNKSGVMDKNYHDVGVDYNYTTAINGQGFLLRCSDIRNGTDADSRVFTARIKAIGAMAESRDLSELGYSAEIVKALEDMMTRTNGAFFFTGATGSGKTTAINACGDYYLRFYNERRRLMTVQDPIEREFPGMPNIDVSGSDDDTDSKLEMVNKLFLRHAPDAIIYSEVRDAKMLTRMLELSRTGHLVGSTIHTTDWAMFFPRLEEDFKVSINSLLRSNLLLFLVSQTLLSQPCQTCSKSFQEMVDSNQMDSDLRMNLEQTFGQAADKLRFHVFGVNDCPECAGAGIVGRNPAYEMFIFDEQTNGDVLDLVRERKYFEAYKLWADKPSNGINGEPLANRAFNLAICGLADARSALSQIQGRYLSRHLREKHGLIDREGAGESALANPPSQDESLIELTGELDRPGSLEMLGG